MSVRILILSAGSGPSNNLMRSLTRVDANVELFGCHSDRFTLNLSPAERNFLVPPLDREVVDSAARFDEVLRSIVSTYQLDLIIPGNDRDGLVLAKMNEQRPFSCHTLLPSANTIALCQDKFVLNQLLSKNGIPVAQTYPITGKHDVVKAWHALAPRELAWCRVRQGYASRGATMVRDADQAWSWISYWHTMRGVAVEEFTLAEFLPGRDYNVQGLWSDGRLVLIKMCERLSYLNADHHPSGMASTPALAKTTWEPAVIETCEAALHVIDPNAHGIFNFDLKENKVGVPCVTEINAGRFAMITNLYDFTGRYSMVGAYVRMACGEAFEIEDPHDRHEEYYLIRELDTLPVVLSGDQLSARIESV